MKKRDEISKALQIPDTFDPDDRRRRQILNIILSFFTVSGLFSIISTIGDGNPLWEILQDPNGLLALLSSIAVVIVSGFLFALNRWERVGTLAGWIFVIALTAIVSISDTPLELVGSGLIFWTLPILASGIVLPPRSVFIAALIVSLVNIYILTLILHVPPNPYAIVVFFAIAALTWLGMSIANSAIRSARLEAQKNAAILNGVADNVVVLNEHDQVVLANPVALSLMGSGIAKLSGDRKSQQELRGRILAFECSVLNQGILFDRELPLAWKSLTGNTFDERSVMWIYIIS